MAKTFRAENVCPKCDSHLIIREGQSGDFLACPRFPKCRYTESLYGVAEVKEFKTPSPYCGKCSHTGLLPFTNVSGTIVPDAFEFCECHDRQEQSYPYYPRPDDFDFPISHDFYRYYCQGYGQRDPGSCFPPDLDGPEVVSVPPEPSNIQQQVDKLRVALADERNKINEHLDKKPKKGRDYV